MEPNNFLAHFHPLKSGRQLPFEEDQVASMDIFIPGIDSYT